MEGVEEPGRDVRGVIAAKVLEVMAHPNADRLTLVDVDTGAGQTRVVCGAQNVAAGDLVPFAPAGAQIPGGVLERRTIRGVESDGMLLAPDELGMGDDHAGIIHLDPATEPGTDVRALLGLDDVIFDLSITPNRPDAMCIVGVARELAAHFGWPLAVPEPVAPTAAGVASDISVRIEAPERCPRYLGRVAGVTLGPSPAWMAERLVKAGMRPISNVVDVTNYVLLERNQPLHAFDLSRLGGRGILVRLARDGERMTTLDGVERELAPEDLLICDAEGTPQAIAGIMGGSTSEVSDGTTEILLESAYFDRMGIARSSKRLKLRSESSARFERGIDPDGIAVNAERAMELLVQVAGARVAPEAVDEYPSPIEPVRIRVRTTKVNAVLGTELATPTSSTRCGPSGSPSRAPATTSSRSHPTFRPDLDREADIVEEVARRVGFDHIGRTVPRPREQVGGAVPDAARAAGGRRRAPGRRFLRGHHAAVGRTGRPRTRGRAVDRVVEAANPLRAEESVLRPAILPGLLRAVARNRAHGIADVALFETRSRLPRRRRTAHCCPTSRCTSRSCSRAPPPPPVEDDRAGRPVRRHRRSAGGVRRAGARRPRLEGGAPPASIPTRAARSSSTARPSASSERSTPTCSRPSSSPAPVVAAEVDLDASSVRPARPRLPHAVALPAVQHRPRLRRRRAESRPTRWRRPCAPPPATSSRTSACSTCSAPTPSAPAAGASRSRCGSAPPDRTLTDAEVAECAPGRSTR